MYCGPNRVPEPVRGAAVERGAEDDDVGVRVGRRVGPVAARHPEERDVGPELRAVSAWHRWFARTLAHGATSSAGLRSKKPERLEPERDDVDRHHRPVLRARSRGGCRRRTRAPRRCPAIERSAAVHTGSPQSIAALVHELAARPALVGVERRDPQRVPEHLGALGTPATTGRASAGCRRPARACSRPGCRGRCAGVR